MDCSPTLINLSDENLDQYVYRIISIDRLIELFNIKKNALVRPVLWKDPWENIVFKSPVKINGEFGSFGDLNKCYGQCWTYHKASDAMWQIYSPDGKGVRIKVKVRNLAKLFEDQIGKLTPTQCAIGNVDYLSPKDFKLYLKDPFPQGLNQESYFATLLKKREAYEHEKELRVLFFSGGIDDDEKWFSSNRDLFYCDLDPIQIIEQIRLHPSIKGDEIKKIKNLIVKKTNFPIRKIIPSKLYQPPKLITINI